MVHLCIGQTKNDRPACSQKQYGSPNKKMPGTQTELGLHGDVVSNSKLLMVIFVACQKRRKDWTPWSLKPNAPRDTLQNCDVEASSWFPLGPPQSRLIWMPPWCKILFEMWENYCSHLQFKPIGVIGELFAKLMAGYYLVLTKVSNEWFHVGFWFAWR